MKIPKEIYFDLVSNQHIGVNDAYSGTYEIIEYNKEENNLKIHLVGPGLNGLNQILSTSDFKPHLRFIDEDEIYFKNKDIINHNFNKNKDIAFEFEVNTRNSLELIKIELDCLEIKSLGDEKIKKIILYLDKKKNFEVISA